MNLLPLCPTYACLSFVLPGHERCIFCERKLLMRPQPESPAQAERELRAVESAREQREALRESA
jgi:hypothetical protein